MLFKTILSVFFLASAFISLHAIPVEPKGHLKSKMDPIKDTVKLLRVHGVCNFLQWVADVQLMDFFCVQA